MSYVPAEQVDLKELRNLSIYDLERAAVIPLGLDPLILWQANDKAALSLNWLIFIVICYC